MLNQAQVLLKLSCTLGKLVKTQTKGIRLLCIGKMIFVSVAFFNGFKYINSKDPKLQNHCQTFNFHTACQLNYSCNVCSQSKWSMNIENILHYVKNCHTLHPNIYTENHSTCCEIYCDAPTLAKYTVMPLSEK